MINHDLHCYHWHVFHWIYCVAQLSLCIYMMMIDDGLAMQTSAFSETVAIITPPPAEFWNDNEIS